MKVGWREIVVISVLGVAFTITIDHLGIVKTLASIIP